MNAVKESMFHVLEKKNLPINRNISVGRGTSLGEIGHKFSIPIQFKYHAACVRCKWKYVWLSFVVHMLQKLPLVLSIIHAGINCEILT